MRSNAAEYGMSAPANLQTALEMLAEGGTAPMAGGTELMVALCAGRLSQKRFLSLHKIDELRFIDASDPDTLRVGATTTFTDIRECAFLAAEFPLLPQTAAWTGSIANQNRGTLGGNIANASPAADTPPALLAYAAELELVSLRGTRTVPYSEFHLGYKRTTLAPDELIFAVRLPRRFSESRQWVRKVGTRNAQAISKVALAAVAVVADGVIEEIALGAASLFDRPARLHATEAALAGKRLDAPTLLVEAQAALKGEARPIDDIRSTARYRTQVACNLLEEFLQSCAVA